MQIRDNLDPTVATPAEADTSALREMVAAMNDGPVVTIELTPEQQAHLAQQTGGRIDATSLKLRPNLNLKAFLSEATDVAMDDLATECAPPPKGTAWVVTSGI